MTEDNVRQGLPSGGLFASWMFDSMAVHPLTHRMTKALPVHSRRHRHPTDSQFSCVRAFQRRDSGTEGEDRCPAGTVQGWGALARGGGGIEGRSLPDKRPRTCRGRSLRRHELPPRSILPVGQGYQIKTRPDRTRWRRNFTIRPISCFCCPD